MIKQISKDILEAAKSGYSLKRDLLRLLKGTLDQSGGNPADEEVMAVIKKMIKSNSLTMESMRSTSSEDSWTEEWKDSFSKLKVENEILISYLPKELSESEMEEILNQSNLKSAKSVGQAIGIAMKTLKLTGSSVNPDLVKLVVERIYQ